MSGRSRKPHIKIVVVLLIGAVFLADWHSRLGLAVAMLYVIPVFIASLTLAQEWAFTLALVSTVLTYLGYFVSPWSMADPDDVLFNRFMAAVMVWIIALLGWGIRSRWNDLPRQGMFTG